MNLRAMKRCLVKKHNVHERDSFNLRGKEKQYSTMCSECLNQINEKGRSLSDHVTVKHNYIRVSNINVYDGYEHEDKEVVKTCKKCGWKTIKITRHIVEGYKCNTYTPTGASSTVVWKYSDTSTTTVTTGTGGF